MNRERFIRQRRSDWQEFETLVSRLRGRRQRTWASRDVADLVKASIGPFATTCHWCSRENGALDLNSISMIWSPRDTMHSTDQLRRRCQWSGISSRMIFLETFRRRIRAFSLALALFLIPFLVSTWVGWQRPDLAEMIAGKESLDAARENFGQELYTDMDARYAGQRSEMAGFYVNNNTGIAFQAYALGAFIGLGTCFILLSNGISIGMVTGYILSAGPPTTENFLQLCHFARVI